MLSMLQGCPYKWTATMALVRAVIARSTSSGSISIVCSSTSTNTGAAPASAIGRELLLEFAVILAADEGRLLQHASNRFVYFRPNRFVLRLEVDQRNDHAA